MSEGPVLCPDDACDGLLVLRTVIDKDVVAFEEIEGMSAMATNTRGRRTVVCPKCDRTVALADAEESSAALLSQVIGKIRRGELFHVKQPERGAQGG